MALLIPGVGLVDATGTLLVPGAGLVEQAESAVELTAAAGVGLLSAAGYVPSLVTDVLATVYPSAGYLRPSGRPAA